MSNATDLITPRIKCKRVTFYHQGSLTKAKSSFFRGHFAPPLFDVGKKKPGHQLMFLGDSLLDQGNTSSLLEPFGIVPFPEIFLDSDGNPILDSNGNTIEAYSDGKASDGLVLGEAIAKQFGINPKSIVSRELDILSSFTTSKNKINIFKKSVNYAYAAATTGFSGSEGNNLQDFPIGLLSQVEQFHQDFDLLSQTPPYKNCPPYKNLVKKDLIHLDGIISAGSNDIFETLAEPNISSILGVLSTPDDSDNQFLINQTADEIFNNIKDAINGNEDRDILGIGDKLNNIVIIGLIPLGDTPFAIQADQLLDQQIDQLFGFDLDVSGQTRDFLTGIAAAVNTKLINEFDNPVSDVEDVFVIDGFEVFENAQLAWKDDLKEKSLIPISEISYSDYILGNIPDELFKEQFFFFDGVHPTEKSNKLLAQEITQLISSEFPDFSFA